MRKLEEELGTKLFRRLARRVELTELGRSYLGEVQAALAHLEQASMRIRSRDSRSILTISVLPSLGSFWLMPRLAGFTQKHPEIDTRIVSSIRPADLHSGEDDVAIRVGQLPGQRYDRRVPRVALEMIVNWRGVVAEELAEDVLVPVCSPALLRARGTVRNVTDLLELTLIHTIGRPNAWADWLQAQGLPPPPPRKGVEYGHFFMAMDAAREGAGVAIVPEILLSGPSLHGLVIPFESKLPSAARYYLLYLDSRIEEKKICLFRSWIHDQLR